MPQWDEMQVRARKLIDEGLKLLKSGMSEAEYLAEATANAAKLHIAVRRNRLDKYRLLHDIGEEVSAQTPGSGSGNIHITDVLSEKIARVHALDEEARRVEEHIANLSIVKKGQASVETEDEDEDEGDDDGGDDLPHDEGRSLD